MPAWLFHGWTEDAIAAAKARGMYLVALAGLRLAPRRTLSQWTVIDVTAAVALSAIIGRTAIAGDQSLIEDEVLAHLRRHGVDALADVRYVLYESKGELTIVRERGPEMPDPKLVTIALRKASAPDDDTRSPGPPPFRTP